MAWCLKKFWTQIDTARDQDEWTLEKTNQFFDNFESLNESMKKLSVKTDFVYFFKELTLNAKSCELLTFQIRRDLLKKITKFLKREQAQNPSASANIERVLSTELHQIQVHLKLMESAQKLIDKIESKDLKRLNSLYLTRFDKELGEMLRQNVFESEVRVKKVEDILVCMVFDAYSIETLNELIETLDMQENISIKSLIKLSLNTIGVSLKEKKLVKGSNHREKLQVLLASISSYVNKEISDAAKEEPKKAKKVKDQQRGASNAKIINDEEVIEVIFISLKKYLRKYFVNIFYYPVVT